MKRADNIKRVCLIGVFMVVLAAFGIWLNKVEKTKILETEGRTFEKARVVSIIKDNLLSDGSRAGAQEVEVEIRTGEHKGEILSATSSSSYLYGADCTVGLKVIVIISEADDYMTVSVYNYDRGTQLYVIIGIFLVILGLIGGKKGWKSAIGLVFTFGCIIFVFLPLVYRGLSPIFAAAFIVVQIGRASCRERV